MAPSADRSLGPVEVGRGIQVADEEHRNPLRRQAGQDLELGLERRQPEPSLQREHLLERLAVPHPVGAVGIGGQVDVRQGHDPVGCDDDERVGPVRAGRLENRVLRHDVHAAVPVVPTERPSEPWDAGLALLDADDVRVDGLDRLDDLVEVDERAAVLDVERHDRQPHRLRRGLTARGRAAEHRRPTDAGEHREQRSDPDPERHGRDYPLCRARVNSTSFVTVHQFRAVPRTPRTRSK